jgi:membrane protein required for colicin V production
MKGLIVAAFSVVAILLGIICSLKLSQSLATWMLEKGYTTAGWAPLLSYSLMFVGVVLLVRLLGKVVQRSAEGLMLGFANKLAGGVLYAIAGAVVYSSAVWLSDKMHLYSADLVAASKTYPFFVWLAPWFFSAAGILLPFAREIFFKLEHALGGVTAPERKAE